MSISNGPDIVDRFRQAMRGVASTVTVVTAHNGVRHHGMTATAVMPVSMEPPSLAICINRGTLLHEILATASRFCVNILGDRQQPVSAAFAGARSADERFNEGLWRFEDDGLGYLADAQASIICTKVAVFPYGTHSLLIGEVSGIRLADRHAPLVYLDAGYCAPVRASARS